MLLVGPIFGLVEHAPDQVAQSARVAQRDDAARLAIALKVVDRLAARHHRRTCEKARCEQLKQGRWLKVRAHAQQLLRRAIARVVQQALDKELSVRQLETRKVKQLRSLSHEQAKRRIRAIQMLGVAVRVGDRIAVLVIRCRQLRDLELQIQRRLDREQQVPVKPFQPRIDLFAGVQRRRSGGGFTRRHAAWSLSHRRAKDTTGPQSESQGNQSENAPLREAPAH